MNSILNGLGDVLFLPLSVLHPVLAILVLAVLVAAGSLLVFKWTSDQKKIREAKGPMKADLLGIFLFRHDLRQVFRALLLSFGRSLANARFIVVPMAVMIVPLVLLFVQFEMRLGMAGIEPGESAVLHVRVDGPAALSGVALEVPDGIVVETPGVRVLDPARERCEVDFRVRFEKAGTHEIVVRSGDRSETKRVTVGVADGAVSPVRARGFTTLLYPVEKPLPGDGPIAGIELSHPQVTYAFLGIDWAWWVLFLVFMMIALFALRGPLGVDF